MTAKGKTSIRIDENLNYKYNEAHMLVYDIEAKYENVYSAKLQIQIGDQHYGYDVLFDDMKGIIEWNKDLAEIQKDHKEDGTSIEFKGLVDMFGIDLQNHVNLAKHTKKKEAPKKKGKDSKQTEILINYNQSKGLASYVIIKHLSMDNTTFNKLVQELTSQGLYATYDEREDENVCPEELYIGKTGTFMSDNDMVNLTKTLDKKGIDMSNYQFVNVKDTNVLPASALIRQTLLNQTKDL